MDARKGIWGILASDLTPDGQSHFGGRSETFAETAVYQRHDWATEKRAARGKCRWKVTETILRRGNRWRLRVYLRMSEAAGHDPADRSSTTRALAATPVLNRPVTPPPAAPKLPAGRTRIIWRSARALCGLPRPWGQCGIFPQVNSRTSLRSMRGLMAPDVMPFSNCSSVTNSQIHREIRRSDISPNSLMS
jgi:hypothetical protein